MSDRKPTLEYRRPELPQRDPTNDAINDRIAAVLLIILMGVALLGFVTCLLTHDTLSLGIVAVASWSAPPLLWIAWMILKRR